MNSYQQYLQEIAKPFQKIAKLDFLQPDNSVAFSLDSNHKRGYMSRYDSRAFIQSGSLSVTLANGQRRKATITLANVDKQFEFAVNNLWIGQKVRLSMGIRLSTGEDFYLPQMVGYISNPQSAFEPGSDTVTFPIVDKWAALDGTIWGTFPASHKVLAGSNIYAAMRKILQLSKYTYINLTTEQMAKYGYENDFLDNVIPVFTNYYDDKTYLVADSDGAITQNVSMLTVPYDATETMGGTAGKLMLQLNDMLAGIIGYNAVGAMTVEPSQQDISDATKPILWTFTPENSQLLKINETTNTSDIYNNVIITGEGLSGKEVWGAASNYDPRSETNINLIGMRTLVESGAGYWNSQQCVSLANWKLKRKCIVQKSVNISSSQMFHLAENELVRVIRTDKPNTPVETHLINSFTLPIGESGEMTINATSVNDIATITTTSSEDEND